MSLTEQIFQSLGSSREYRHAFLEETIRTGLAVQIKTIRENREGMTQKAFGAAMSKSQSWVSRLEDPNEPIPTVPTLLQVAKTLDVGLEVRFVSFAKIARDSGTLNPKSLYVPEFNRDPEVLQRTSIVDRVGTGKRFPMSPNDTRRQWWPNDIETSVGSSQGKIISIDTKFFAGPKVARKPPEVEYTTTATTTPMIKAQGR
jgi:transcriptional regulator with XRE-family HTH domain